MAASISTSIIACLRSFNEFIAEIKRVLPPKSSILRLDATSWEDELGRLRMWAANIGAHQTGQSSLDFRLRESSHIREQIVKLLEDLLQRLQDARDVLFEDDEEVDPEDLTSEASDSDEETTEIQELRESVATIINCLFQMSMLVRKPAKHDMIMGSKRAEVAMFEPYDYNHVRDKYPKADISIIERLGLAVTRRRKYLKYRERHALKLKQGINRIIPEIRDVQSIQEGGTAAEGPVSFLSDTIATDVKVPNVRFDDEASESGASQTSYAVTLLGKGNITIPRPPKNSQDGSPFECPYCHFIITTKAAGSWNRHVFQDLQPYVCIAVNCSTPEKLYSTRHEWLHHLRAIHTTDSTLNVENKEAHKSFTCPLCKDSAQSEKLYDRHVARHLQELALFILPRTDDDSGDDEPKDHSGTNSKGESTTSGNDSDKVNSMRYTFWGAFDRDLLKAIIEALIEKVPEFERIGMEFNPHVLPISYPLTSRDEVEIRAFLEGTKRRLEMLCCNDSEHEEERKRLLCFILELQDQVRYLETKGSPAPELVETEESDMPYYCRKCHQRSQSQVCPICSSNLPGAIDSSFGAPNLRINEIKDPGDRTSNDENNAGSTEHRQSSSNVSGQSPQNSISRPSKVQYYRVVKDTYLFCVPNITVGQHLVDRLWEGDEVEILQMFDTVVPDSGRCRCRTRDGREGMVPRNALDWKEIETPDFGDSAVPATSSQADPGEDLSKSLDLVGDATQSKDDPVTDNTEHDNTSPDEGIIEKEPLGSSLRAAIKNGQFDVAKELLEQGASPDFFEEKRAVVADPLYLATVMGHDDLVRLLLSFGASVNAHQPYGSVLHVAADQGLLTIANLLLTYGANPNCRSQLHWGGTPLHVAATRGNTAIVELLLSAGADVNARNDKHRTVLDVARRGGQAQNVTILELVATRLLRKAKR